MDEQVRDLLNRWHVMLFDCIQLYQAPSIAIDDFTMVVGTASRGFVRVCRRPGPCRVGRKFERSISDISERSAMSLMGEEVWPPNLVNIM